MQLQLCIVYLSAGLGKLQGAVWWNGTALWDPLVNYELSLVRHPWHAEALRALVRSRWLTELVLTAGVVFTFAVEIGFPFLVWQRGLRYPMIVAALLLHVFIGVFMGLHLFSLIMIILVLAFLPPQDVRSGLHRL